MNLARLRLFLCMALLAPGLVHAACTLPLGKPDGIYLDNGNGTVTDTKTGLMWLKCTVGLTGSTCASGTPSAYTWKDALAIAEASGAAGYGDWRLPNAKELASLVDLACSSPAINSSFFPASESGSYWTSSPSNQSADSAVSVDFATGAMSGSLKDTVMSMRLVRKGY